MNASPIQRQEMRRAFYAGVMSLLTLQKDRLGDDDINEEESVAVLESIEQECVEFVSQIGRKY